MAWGLGRRLTDCDANHIENNYTSMKLPEGSADLIFSGQIPWDVVEYMAVATRVEEVCKGDFLTESVRTSLRKIVHRSYSDTTIAASHVFRFEAIQRFIVGAAPTLVQRGMAIDTGSELTKLSCALLEALCRSRYSIDVRTVTNPSPTLSIFPADVFKVAAALMASADAAGQMRSN